MSPNNTPLRKILYAEDEADIREIAVLALESFGNYQVETCASGGEVFEAARRFHPQLILLDVMMPHLDGPSTLAQLKQQPDLANIPVVFLTAKILPEEIERFKRLGAVDVIAKPFDPVSLPDQIARIWGALHD